MNAPDFDRLARIYRWCEYLALGPLLERTRTHHLPALARTRHALILGDGDGRFTAALLAANPSVKTLAVDASQAMLFQLRRNAARSTLTSASRLRTLKADVREVSVSRGTDLIVTHFLLDCLSQPEVDTLIARLAAPLAPGALWVVSEFRIPKGVLRYPARLYIRILYLAFRVLTGLRTQRLPDHTTPLTRAGFQPVATHRKLAGILTTELWQKQ